MKKQIKMKKTKKQIKMKKMKKTKKQIKNIFPISPNRKYSVCRTKIFKLKNISRGKSKNVVFDENDNPSPPTLQITPNLCHTKKRWETVIYFSLIFLSQKKGKVKVRKFSLCYSV